MLIMEIIEARDKSTDTNASNADKLVTSAKDNPTVENEKISRSEAKKTNSMCCSLNVVIRLMES